MSILAWKQAIKLGKSNSCFQVDNFVSKLVMFPNYVSKFAIINVKRSVLDFFIGERSSKKKRSYRKGFTDWIDFSVHGSLITESEVERKYHM